MEAGQREATQIGFAKWSKRVRGMEGRRKGGRSRRAHPGRPRVKLRKGVKKEIELEGEETNKGLEKDRHRRNREKRDMKKKSDWLKGQEPHRKAERKREV